MMNDKERFITLLEALQRQECLDESFNEAMKSINLLHGNFYYDNSLLSDAIISVANGLLPDPEEDWVSWFMEMNDCEGPNVHKNGVAYTIRKPEELWDFCYL